MSASKISEVAEKIASRFGSDSLLGSRHQPEDLKQEILLAILTKADSFGGRSRVTTWAHSVARNKMISMIRAERIRPDARDEALTARARSVEPSRTAELRETTRRLLAALKEERSPEWAYEVLVLMLRSHGDHDFTATAMTLHTGEPWTARRVRALVWAIRETPHGEDLIEVLTS